MLSRIVSRLPIGGMNSMIGAVSSYKFGEETLLAYDHAHEFYVLQAFKQAFESGHAEKISEVDKKYMSNALKFMKMGMSYKVESSMAWGAIALLSGWGGIAVLGTSLAMYSHVYSKFKMREFETKEDIHAQKIEDEVFSQRGRN